MASTTTTVLNNLFKQNYAPDVKDSIRQQSWLIREIKRIDPIKTNSKGVEMTVRTKQSASYGARPESGVFPMPDTVGFQTMNLGYKMEYATGEVSGVAILAAGVDSKTGGTNNLLGFAGALARTLQYETEDFTRKLNRNAYGDGSGAVTSPITARTTGVGGTVTVSLTAQNGSDFVIVDSRHNFYTTAGVKHDQSGAVPISVVTANDVSTGVITYDTVPTDVAVGDIPVYDGSFGLTPNGLRGIIQDANITFQGLNVSNFPNLKGTVYDAAGADLDFKMVDKVIARVSMKGYMGLTTDDYTFITNPIQMNALKNFVYANQTIQTGTDMRKEKVDLGLQKITINGIDINLDNDCGKSEFFGVRMKSLVRIALMEPGLLPIHDDEYMTLKNTTAGNAHAYQYYFAHIGNLGTDEPSANFRIKNLDTTDLY